MVLWFRGSKRSLKLDPRRAPMRAFVDGLIFATAFVKSEIGIHESQKHLWNFERSLRRL